MTAAGFGIDLGTTNSVIARLEEGRAIPIPIDGSPIVPSIVLFDAGRVVVGREARNLELLHPERTIRSAKRRMGQPHRYRVDGRELAPEEVSAEVLRALKQGAEQATGEPVREVVITVPAYFDDAQRRATLRAGELAGLEVLRLLNEPTSASLVYEQAVAGTGGERPELVLVYDLGGGTFHVSVLEVFQGVREV
ncbi:MAG TPA: Hsp70 family protein, partial [Myxococcaceae bacterium]|nr:Hsp70 family protein [Myxococcaceae bacterium]